MEVPLSYSGKNIDIISTAPGTFFLITSLTLSNRLLIESKKQKKYLS